MPSRYSFPSNGPYLPPSLPSPPQRTEVSLNLCHTIIESIHNSKFIVVPLGLDHVEGQCALVVWYPWCENLSNSKEDANSKILHSVLQHFTSKEVFKHSKMQNALHNSILGTSSTVTSLLTFRKAWNEVLDFEWPGLTTEQEGRELFAYKCFH